jgi:hypothetical protein
VKLHWMLAGTCVDENTLTPLPGKDLELEVRTDSQPPTSLQVYQIYGSLIRQALKHIGIPERHAGPEFQAKHIAKGLYRSDRKWRLPEPRGWRKSAAYKFTDDFSQSLSPAVYASRLGKGDLVLRGGGKIEDPTHLTPIGVDGVATFAATLEFATDPELTVEVLTGEALVDHLVRNIRDDVASTDDPESLDVTSRIELALDDLRYTLEAAYTPPSRWDATLSSALVSGSEGETAQIDLDLSAPTPGIGFFAVSFYDPEHPGLAETTDAWAIVVDDDRQVFALADPSEMPLREPAGA